MVEKQQSDEEQSNPLEDMLFSGGGGFESAQTYRGGSSQQPPRATLPQREEQSAFAPELLQSSSSSDNEAEESEDEDEEECDVNGDVAICDACKKVIPLSKYEAHISYFCKKQQAECPLCFLKMPMGKIQEHMPACQLLMLDPDLVTCKYCKQRMRKAELSDHAIAHIIHQQMVERQVVQRIVDQEEFFEEEKLESAKNGVAPCLMQSELSDLPIHEFKPNAQHSENETLQCAICQFDFVQGEKLRTLRCLHLFHQECIDTWLTKSSGSCVVCKVVQVPNEPQQRPQRRPMSPTTRAVAATETILHSNDPRARRVNNEERRAQMR